MWILTILAIVVSQSAPAAPRAPQGLDEGEKMTPQTAHLFLLEHDRNKDGRLTLDELPEDLRRRFARADTDHNGELDAREILVGPSRISREARRIEGLRLTRRGLERKTGPLAPGDSVEFRVSNGLLQRLDHNKDGYADGTELGTIVQQPDALFGDRPYSMTAEEARALAQQMANRPLSAGPLSAAPLGEAGRGESVAAPRPLHHAPSAFDPNLVPHGPSLPARPDMADITADQQAIPQVAPPAVHATPEPDDRAEPVANHAPSQDNMPDAATILEHLDKNKNGQLDRNEAVDQLAENFDKLDRNRDNMLSEKEIKRGLFLARMLGIKPKQDPRTYRAHKPEDRSGDDTEHTAEPPPSTLSGSPQTP